MLPDEFVSPVRTYRLPSLSKPMSPPMWQHEWFWYCHSMIGFSELRSSLPVASSNVKRATRRVPMWLTKSTFEYGV